MYSSRGRAVRRRTPAPAAALLGFRHREHSDAGLREAATILVVVHADQPGIEGQGRRPAARGVEVEPALAAQVPAVSAWTFSAFSTHACCFAGRSPSPRSRAPTAELLVVLDSSNASGPPARRERSERLVEVSCSDPYDAPEGVAIGSPPTRRDYTAGVTLTNWMELRVLRRTQPPRHGASPLPARAPGRGPGGRGAARRRARHPLHRPPPRRTPSTSRSGWSTSPRSKVLTPRARCGPWPARQCGRTRPTRPALQWGRLRLPGRCPFAKETLGTCIHRLGGHRFSQRARFDGHETGAIKDTVDAGADEVTW